MSFFDQMKKKAAEAGNTNELKEDHVAKAEVKVEIVAEVEKVQTFELKEMPVEAEAAPVIKSDSKIDNSIGKHFAVGIDLGTTHCVLSYADITDIEAEFSQQVMGIPQLTSPSIIEAKLQLPSFLYQAHESELPANSIVLPWSEKPDFIIGEIARSLGSKTPIRLVSSAKSWLCHAGIDCKSPILPADAPDEVERVSPFEATKAYLEHMSSAWLHLHPNAPLSEQDLVLTVPASFDPAARELTVEAARAYPCCRRCRGSAWPHPRSLCRQWEDICSHRGFTGQRTVGGLNGNDSSGR